MAAGPDRTAALDVRRQFVPVTRWSRSSAPILRLSSVPPTWVGY